MGEKIIGITVGTPIKPDLVGGGSDVDLSEYVKNTDYATKDNAGVVKITDYDSGLIMSSGKLKIASSTKANIREKKHAFKPITPDTLDYAVKTSITTNTETLTEEEKANACEWLGVATGKWETIVYNILGIPNGSVNEVSIKLTSAQVKKLKECNTLMCVFSFFPTLDYSADRFWLRAHLHQPYDIQIPLVYAPNTTIKATVDYEENEQAYTLSQAINSEVGFIARSTPVTQYTMFNSAVANEYTVTSIHSLKDIEESLDCYITITLAFSSSQTETQYLGDGTYFKLMGRKA